MRWFAPPLIVLALHAAPARADIPMPVYTWTGADTATQIVSRDILNRSLDTGSSSSSASAKRYSLAVAPASSKMVAKLAAQTAPTRRADAERAYRELLQKYPQVAQTVGIPADDLAGAAAIFIAASYQAYTGTVLPDAAMKPLYEQLRTTISTNPTLGRASAIERRETYEQLVILGMYLALAELDQLQHPDARMAAQLKTSGRGYLQGFLGVDPDKIAITERGLVKK